MLLQTFEELDLGVTTLWLHSVPESVIGGLGTVQQASAVTSQPETIPPNT